MSEKKPPMIYISYPDLIDVLKIPDIAETGSVEALKEMISRYVLTSHENSKDVYILQVYEHIKEDVDRKFEYQRLYMNLMEEYPEYFEIFISDNKDMLSHKIRKCIVDSMNKILDADVIVIKYLNDNKTSFTKLLREMLFKHFYVWDSQFDEDQDTFKIAQKCCSCRMESDRILVPFIESENCKREPFCKNCEEKGFYNKEIFTVEKRGGIQC